MSPTIMQSEILVIDLCVKECLERSADLYFNRQAVLKALKSQKPSGSAVNL